MTLSKIWLDLVPTDTDEYTTIASKTKSDIGVYAVEGIITNRCTMYTGDILSIIQILRNELKTPETQPTPIFFFTENNTCAINIWRVVANIISSPPFGLSHLCCLAPIRFLEQPDNNTVAKTTIQNNTVYISTNVNIYDILANSFGFRPSETIDMPNSTVTKTASIPVNLGGNYNIGSYILSSIGIGLVKHIKVTNKYSIPAGATKTRCVNAQSLQQKNDTTQITSSKQYAGITAKRIGLLCDSSMCSSLPTSYQNYTQPDTDFDPNSLSTATIFPATATEQRIFYVTVVPIDQENNTLKQLDDQTVSYGGFYAYRDVKFLNLNFIYPYIEQGMLVLHGEFDTYLHTVQEGYWHRTVRYAPYKIKTRAGAVLYKRAQFDTPLEVLGYSVYINNITTYKIGILLNINFGTTFGVPAAIQFMLIYQYEDGTIDTGSVTTNNIAKNQGGYLVLNETGVELASALLSSYENSVDAKNDAGDTNPIQSLTPFPNFERAGYTPIPSNGKKIVRVTFYKPEGTPKPPNDSTNYEPNLLLVLSPKTA